ncbi:MAG: serine hydrolase domain-containing protein [Anaerolineae bacterium]|jgi:CubicO group peptidase (beta-lactamase class C family)
MTVKLDARRLEAAATPALQALIDNQTYAGFSAAVWQGDELVYQRFFGQRDREAGIAYDGDAIVRIYSMSKPITGALMAFLWDRGLWRIDDPVAHYIPEFAQARVYVSGGPDGYRTEPAKTTMTLRHLFTHTAGLSYGFAEDDPVDQIYRQGPPGGYLEGDYNPDLQEFVAMLAQMPLRFDSGTGYNYSFAIDVLGRVAEVIADTSFRDLLRADLFEPLGMVDTDFIVDDARLARFAPCYSPTASGGLARMAGEGDARYRPGYRLWSGGGGLTSTLHDYGRFLRMLLNGGELDGVRVLSPEAVRYMMIDHLPPTLFPFEATSPGMGYGLCGSVRVEADPLRAWDPVGVYSWGGAASTSMWVDPVNRIAGITLPQLMPGNFAAGDLLRRTVYQIA